MAYTRTGYNRSYRTVSGEHELREMGHLIQTGCQSYSDGSQLWTQGWIMSQSLNSDHACSTVGIRVKS